MAAAERLSDRIPTDYMRLEMLTSSHLCDCTVPDRYSVRGINLLVFRKVQIRDIMIDDVVAAW